MATQYFVWIRKATGETRRCPILAYSVDEAFACILKSYPGCIIEECCVWSDGTDVLSVREHRFRIEAERQKAEAIERERIEREEREARLTVEREKRRKKELENEAILILLGPPRKAKKSAPKKTYRPRPVRFAMVRKTLPVEDTLPVPVTEATKIDDGYHVLADDVNRREKAMWKSAPWNRRRLYSRRYEGFHVH